MPDIVSIPYTPEKDLISSPLYLGGQSIDEMYALGLVNQTFAHYEAWRRNNHDNRWQLNDMLYFGQVEKRLWEGTNVPRASLSNPLVFDQIEAALPALTTALFGDDEWFDVLPGPTANVNEARDVKDHLRYILQHSPEEFGGTAEIEIAYAIKNILTYGNGGICLEYDPVKKHPVVKWVDVRDVWVDPGTPTPSVDQSKSLIHRKHMTIDELESYRSIPGMKLPSKEVLYSLAVQHTFASADLSKQVSEMMRRVQYNPGYHDDLPLPSDKMVEVLIYYSRTRIIWVLNRQVVAYNQKNPYGFVPYCFAPCYNVTGRFYGMSFPDVIGDIQLYTQALQNLHLDELNLAVMPPRTRKRGSMMTPSQFRWRPGMVTELDSPKDDMTIHYPNGASASVSEDIARLEMMAEKRVGVNSMGSGIPRPSNANRTLGGMNMQMQGSASRLSTIVRHCEDFLIVPMLYKLQRMTQIHSTPNKRLPVMKDRKISSVPSMSFFAPVKFEMQGASKMMTQSTLQQVFPFLTQYLLQGPFLQELPKIGMTIDYSELIRMLQDATGVRRKYEIIRQLNDQEKEALAQPTPEMNAAMQKVQLETQTRKEVTQMGHDNSIQLAQIDAQTRLQMAEEKASTELVKLLMAQSGQQYELDGQKQKLQIELEGMTQKMKLEQMKAMTDLLSSRGEHQQKLQQSREQALNDQAVANVKTQSAIQQQQALGNQKLQAGADSTAQQLLQAHVAHGQKLQHTDAVNRQALDSLKSKMSFGIRSKGASNESKRTSPQRTAKKDSAEGRKR